MFLIEENNDEIRWESSIFDDFLVRTKIDSTKCFQYELISISKEQQKSHSLKKLRDFRMMRYRSLKPIRYLKMNYPIKSLSEQ